jgi:tRNA-dihydrouridine synthase
MNGRESLAAMLAGPAPILALAPMQDVTDLSFWRLIAAFGGADVYFTEYFRVYPGASLNRGILRSITENPTGRPVVAQLIGNDIPALVQAARELQQYPVAAVDLNLGCPAPVVYRKCAGGGLLREPARVDAILGALREAVTTHFTVKTRLGFESRERFAELLAIFARRHLDLVTVHGRTVHELYRSEVHYDDIARAVAELPCPVLANGNVHSAHKAQRVLELTNARGLMIGRGAIRNPWIFRQCRQQWRGERLFVACGRDVMHYLRLLYEAIAGPKLGERGRVQRIKKHLNYIGLGVEPTGQFLHDIRRVATEAELWRICAAFLDHDQPMPLEPFSLPLNATDVLAGEQR